MDFEHLAEVNARIAEIRQRFVDTSAPQAVQSADSSGRVSFGEALKKAGSAGGIACPSNLESAITAAGEKYGVDPAVIKSVIRAESGFRNDAVSRVGAKGLMQIMPGTAKSLGIDRDDPEQNIDGGVRYLKQLVDKFGSLEPALAAYNAGPGSVVRYGGVPPYAETQRYVANVMSNISFYK